MMDARWLRPLGVGEIIDAAFRIYRARFGAMIKAVAVVVIPVQLINVIVVLSLPTTTTRTFNGSGTFTTTEGPSGGAAVAALIVLQIVTVLSTLVATAACLKIVSDAYLGTETSWRDSLRFGLSKTPSILWIAVLSGLGVGLGAILCIAPGIWLYVAWCIGIPVLLVEGLRGSKAMTRSFQLVRGRWWPTFGTLIIAGLITAAVAFALGILSVPLLLSGASYTTRQAVSAITRGIGSVFTTPFSAAVTALIYFELRVRKEGFDLALMAQRIGVEPPPGGFAPAPFVAQHPAQWGTPPVQPWSPPPPANAPWPGPPPEQPWPGPPPEQPWPGPPSDQPWGAPPPPAPPWAAPLVEPPAPEPAPPEPPTLDPPAPEPPPPPPPPPADPPRDG
jgi:hypothetical protein